MDHDLAALLRADLAGAEITEKKMFGGICFLLNGNMVTGSMKTSALFRVGKHGDAAALAIPGTYPMMQRGKPMTGFIELRPPIAVMARAAAPLALWLSRLRALCHRNSPMFPRLEELVRCLRLAG